MPRLTWQAPMGKPMVANSTKLGLKKKTKKLTDRENQVIDRVDALSATLLVTQPPVLKDSCFVYLIAQKLVMILRLIWKVNWVLHTLRQKVVHGITRRKIFYSCGRLMIAKHSSTIMIRAMLARACLNIKHGITHESVSRSVSTLWIRIQPWMIQSRSRTHSKINLKMRCEMVKQRTHLELRHHPIFSVHKVIISYKMFKYIELCSSNTSIGLKAIMWLPRYNFKS